MRPLILAAFALLTILPFQLFAQNPNSISIQGRVRANIDVPFTADSPVSPIITEPPAPPAPVQSYQYSEPAYEYAPQFQTRVRYRLRVQPARLYYQPVVTYEPTAPVLLGDPCLTGFGAYGFGRRERLDIRYRYRSGW